LAGAGAQVADIAIDDLLAEMRAAIRHASIAAMEGAAIHAGWLGQGTTMPVDPRVSGPLARSVAECAAADAVMAGEEPAGLAPVSLGALRIGVPRGRLFENMEEAVDGAFDSCIGRLAGAGAQVADIAIDDLLAEMRAATRHASIAAMEGAAIHAGWLGQGTTVPVDPRVSRPLARAASVPAPVYISAIRRRAELAAAMDERLSDYDVLALPTVPIVAPTIAAMAADEKVSDRTEGLLLRNTQVANQFDLCAISLPMPGATLPTGLMLVARHGHDRRLLGIAAAVESLLAG
jgi:aspartyl-tRNA(Asn)/glutamyl-tRNA(Gln) amidotransferase subunit A